MKKFVKPPLTNLLNRIPQDVLDRPLTDLQLVTISKHVLKWKAKASALGLSAGAIESIREDYKNDHDMQKITMMRKWGQMCGEKACLRQLIYTSTQHNWKTTFIKGVCREMGYAEFDGKWECKNSG